MDKLMLVANTLLFMVGLADNPSKPTYSDDGIAEDWAKVGSDIYAAMNQYEKSK